ncbi:MAG: rhomboid family intramembrane serine protease [Acidobacteriota bacterium]
MRVYTLFFFVIIIRVVPLPAWALLIYWFALQLFSGLGTLGAAQGGGVAFWAHIGGFVAGLVLIKLFKRPQLVSAKRRHVTLPSRDLRRLRW